MPDRYVKVVPVTMTVPVVPVISITIGLSLLLWVLFPIMSFVLFYVPQGIVTPLADDAVVLAAPPDRTQDFSKASTWFPQNPAKKTVTPVDTYTLTIPKLRIKNAIVKIGTDDLSKNLIHYGGTGVPRQPGKYDFFCHSFLPLFLHP